jgi:hypothetical protein
LARGYVIIRKKKEELTVDLLKRLCIFHLSIVAFYFEVLVQVLFFKQMVIRFEADTEHAYASLIDTMEDLL